jgi:hypothetical protein
MGGHDGHGAHLGASQVHARIVFGMHSSENVFVPNIVPPPRILSMVCALMACYVLESSECGSSGQIFIRASACSR